MTRGVVASVCDARGEVVREEEQGALLLDPEKGRPGGWAMETPAERDLVKMVVLRVAKFIVRGLLMLQWVYLFNSMKKHAINYTGGDTWFTTFAVIVVAVPIAEIFCILGQTLAAPVGSLTPCRDRVCACATAANGKVHKEVDALLLDLDKGTMDYRTAPLQADIFTNIAAKAGTTDAHILPLDPEAAKIGKCIIRGLLVLLWVYLVDLMRRYVTSHGVEELFFTICPLGILAIGVSVLFFFLMESLCESILPPKASYSASL